MQFTKHGIPVNIPKGFNPRKKVRVVKQQTVEVSYKHYAELKRMVNGLEESIITPTQITAFNEALTQGYEVINQWTIN